MCSASLLNYSGLRILRSCIIALPQFPYSSSTPFSLLSIFPVLNSMDLRKSSASSSYFVSFANSSHNRGRGRGFNTKDNRERSRGDGGGSGKDKIDALGQLLARVLRHMASELNLKMRSDGFIKVQDLLKLDIETLANISLRLHTVADVKEAIRNDNKQRFSLLEENGELWVRANQGHSIKTIETECLLKPIISAEEAPGIDMVVCVWCAVCVHETYKNNLELILEQGLKRMNRLHVHFSCGLPTNGEVISGKTLR